MIKKTFKKLLPISMAIIILFTSSLVQLSKPSRAYAALPAVLGGGAGVYVLATLAGAGILYGLGKDGTAEDLVKHADRVWTTTTDGFKDILSKTVKWVKKDTALTYDIDFSSLTISEQDLIKSKAKIVANNFSTSIDTKNYESTAIESDSKPTDYTDYPNTVLKTKYIDNYSITRNSNYSYRLAFNDLSPFAFNVTIYRVDGTVHQSFYKGITLVGKEFRYYKDVYYQSASDSFTTGSADGSMFSTKDYAFDIGKKNGLFPIIPEQVSGIATIFATNYALTNMKGLDISIVPYDTIKEISTTVSTKVNESWETMKDAGLVIPESTVKALNPNLTFNPDGTITNQQGLAVRPVDLAIPNLGITDGRLTIPNVGTGTNTDVLTGNPVSGNPTIPGTGEGGILQGLWDWLKGILQAILNAIKALSALIGLTALINLVKNGFDNINKKWDDARAAPKKKVDFSKLKVAAGTLTTVFPFSIPWDFARSISVLNASPQSPVFKVDVSKEVEIAGKKIPIAYKFDLDLGTFDAVAAVGRWAMILIFDISIILALRRLTPD